MKVFRRIVAAVDLSENSEYVKSWSEGLSKELGDFVDYVGVFPKFPDSYLTLLGWSKEFLSGLNKAKEKMFRDISRISGNSGKVHELEGVPDVEIAKFAEDRKASLIVLGFRGAGKSKIPVGSTALGVIRKSSSNVLLVKALFKAPKKIAVAHGFKSTDKSALLIAYAIAKSFGATVYRIHVIDSFFRSLIPDDLMAELKFELEMELSKTFPGVETVPVILDGDVSMELTHWSAKNDVDLIVLGDRPNRIGLLTQELLMQTVNNVLVCRGL